MAEKRVTAENEITLGSLTADDVFLIESLGSGLTKKVKLSTLQLYFLLSKIIGGSGAGDITTNNGSQTLTGKRLTTPKINSANVCNATSEEINKLHNLDTTAAELLAIHGLTAVLGYIATLTSNAQAQIDGKVGITSNQIIHKPYMMTYSWTQSGTTHNIYAADLLNDIGLSAPNRINYITGITLWADEMAMSPAGIEFATQLVDGVACLNYVTIPTTVGVGTVYYVAITFKTF